MKDERIAVMKTLETTKMITEKKRQIFLILTFDIETDLPRNPKKAFPILDSIHDDQFRKLNLARDTVKKWVELVSDRNELAHPDIVSLNVIQRDLPLLAPDHSKETIAFIISAFPVEDGLVFFKKTSNEKNKKNTK